MRHRAVSISTGDTNTKRAKEIAEKREEFMIEFLKRFSCGKEKIKKCFS